MTRRDGLENRERVLRAAIAVFGEHGAEASTERVAEQANVGIATLFRHFPTKESLLAAVLEQMLGELADYARARADARDPGNAFFATLRHALEHSRTKRGVADALGTTGLDVRRRTWNGGLRDAISVLLQRAQGAHAVRTDVGVDEVMAVLAAASRALELSIGHATRERTIEVLLDGLRPRMPATRKRTNR